jgi:Transposase and inactivated derivatives
MSDFKWRHFQGEVILWAVRWYCRYGVSYRDLEHMMGERGVSVDHSTIYRCVQKYAPEIEKRLRWHWRRPRSTSWRVDETYVKVRGKWTYLYRAVDKFGNTIDFYLSPTRNAKAAKRFLGKALNGLKGWEKPTVINTDKAPTYGIAISELKAEGKWSIACGPSPSPLAAPSHETARHCEERLQLGVCRSFPLKRFVVHKVTDGYDTTADLSWLPPGWLRCGSLPSTAVAGAKIPGLPLRCSDEDAESPPV